MLGDLETGYTAAGQVAGLLKEIKPAAQVIHDIVSEAETIAHRWAAKCDLTRGQNEDTALELRI